MTRLYFLDGLGSNHYYAEDLRLALAAKGLDLIYLPLPGHPDNFDALPTSKEDLLDWIGSVLPEAPCTLLGYSLGADLAAAFAHHRPERVDRLVLLDGACVDLSALGLDLAQELEGAAAHLSGHVFGDMVEHLERTQAESGRWSANLERAEAEAYAFDEASGLFRLKLNPDAAKVLLTYRREFGLSLQATDFVTPTHLIISDQPADFLAHKLAVLTAAAPCVSYEVVEGAGHDFYMVYPDQTADRVVSALNKEG